MSCYNRNLLVLPQYLSKPYRPYLRKIFFEARRKFILAAFFN